MLKSKKKIVISVISAVIVVAIIATSIALHLTRYYTDKNDTEPFFRENVNAVGFDNTIETAIPQTKLYDLIQNHFNSELPEGKTEKKAVIIGYDGCRADILREKNDNGGINSLLKDGASINLAYCGGVNYPEKNTQDTSTAPGWCSILTGEWADVHGVTGNDITKSLDTKTLLTSLVENGSIDNSVFLTKWKGHFSRADATYLDEKQYCEDNGIKTEYTLCKNDEATHEAAVAEFSEKDCADFTFIIYEHTDSTGHNKGFTFNNPEYKQAFLDEDACGLEVINTIKARESYENEDWLIVITSDHGGIGTDHGDESIQERMTFIVANKEF